MLHTTKLFAAATVFAGLIAAPVFAESHAPATQEMKPVSEVSGTQLGVMNCTIEGGWGLLLGSSKKVDCSFEHADGSIEKYAGSMDKLGLDIGKTEEAYMTWVVFTTSENKVGDGALAGQYVGVSAGASLGIGLGANALVGGSDKQIGLQPVSVEGVKGLNLAVGLASLTLEKVE